MASRFDNFKIIPIALLKEYLQLVSQNIESQFEALEDVEISNENFSFYTSVASVYSSKIEGEEIDLDSFIKHKRFGMEFLPDYTKKINDLYEAYQFAQKNSISKGNVESLHSILSKNLLPKYQRGKLRSQNMYVTTSDGKIEYVASSPFTVEEEMTKFYDDLEVLLNLEMNIYEAFYFASMIHLVFVKIHPWMDGNGRSARLLEKWFLASKLGKKVWFMQSEKYYYDQHQTYYNNLRNLGLEYQELDYLKALPFLLMLPNAITNESS